MAGKKKGGKKASRVRFKGGSKGGRVDYYRAPDQPYSRTRRTPDDPPDNIKVKKRKQ